MRVLECLDKHYKHLPEVELHESIDDFLFHLKRKPHEGATAFASRFKTALARLENLIAQAKRRKKEDPKRRHLGPATPVESSLEDSSDAGKPPDEDEVEQTDPDVESQPPQPEEPHAFESPKGPRSDPGPTSGPRSDPGCRTKS